MGVSVNETKSENSVAMATVTPKERKNSPMTPPMNAMGRNTTRSTAVRVNAA